MSPAEAPIETNVEATSSSSASSLLQSSLGLLLGIVGVVLAYPVPLFLVMRQMNLVHLRYGAMPYFLSIFGLILLNLGASMVVRGVLSRRPNPGADSVS